MTHKILRLRAQQDVSTCLIIKMDQNSIDDGCNVLITAFPWVVPLIQASSMLHALRGSIFVTHCSDQMNQWFLGNFTSSWLKSSY